MLDAPVRAAAEAYLLNSDNRGIFERSSYFAEQAGAGRDDPEAALQFLLSADFRSEACEELAEIAPKWERMLGQSPLRVLDAGCGPGVTTLAMADRYREAEVVGIDVEPHALKLAAALASDRPRVSFRERPLESFTDEDGFDLIQCRCVIEHVYDPRAAVISVATLLRPGGVAFFEFPNYLWPWEPHLKMLMFPKSPKWLLALQCRLTGRDPHFAEHLNFTCDPVSMSRWLADASGQYETVDLMAEKVHDVFAGTGTPKVASRARVVRWMRRRPRVRKLALGALTRLPMTPSVVLLVRRLPGSGCSAG